MSSFEPQCTSLRSIMAFLLIIYRVVQFIFTSTPFPPHSTNIWWQSFKEPITMNVYNICVYNRSFLNIYICLNQCLYFYFVISNPDGHVYYTVPFFSSYFLQIYEVYHFIHFFSIWKKMLLAILLAIMLSIGPFTPLVVTILKQHNLLYFIISMNRSSHFVNTWAHLVDYRLYPPFIYVNTVGQPACK